MPNQNCVPPTGANYQVGLVDLLLLTTIMDTALHDYFAEIQKARF